MSTDTALSFNGLRNAAYHRCQELGLPTSKAEAWRYVDCKPLADSLEDDAAPRQGVVVPVGKSSEPGMVITNGSWDPQASPSLPPGVEIHAVAGDSRDGDPLVARWARQLPNIDDVATLWSFSDMRSGMHMHIDRPIDRPLIILNLATDAHSAWRSLVTLGEGASATVLLIHLVSPRSRSSVGLEVECAAGSRLTVNEVEFSSNNEQHLGQLFMNKELFIQSDAEVVWNCAGRGGKLVRHRWLFDLLGEGASASCRAGAMVRDQAQHHHYLRMRHAHPNTRSAQLFKQVLTNGGRASFDGLVRIEPGADGSDADQLCRTLILDDDSVMGGRPQLEVLADEVTASHGAAIAQPQPEELLYLRSRGLYGDEARQLLIDAFLAEIANGFSFSAAQALAEQQLALDLGEDA